MVYKKIHYSFHGAFIIPWNTHDATFMVINGEIQHFHELIMGISWEICLVVIVACSCKYCFMVLCLSLDVPFPVASHYITPSGASLQ